MQTKILITGGTGLVGMKLSHLLAKEGYEVIHLSRKENLNAKYKAYRWDLEKEWIDPRALDVEHVVHLAGAGVADGKWTPARKKLIYDSRINATRLLAKKLNASGDKLKSFVSASAIGLYGADTGEDMLSEDAAKGDDFLAEVVEDWEKAADEIANVPVAKIRIGIVLSNEGGALPKMSLPMKFGFGAPLGSGKQYMSWIHIDDLVSIIRYAIDQKIEGPYNAVAPCPVNNKEFTKKLGKAMHRPVWLPNVPAFALKLALGEMSQVVLGGNRVSSEKIQQHGFDFTYKELLPALKNILT